MSEEDDIEASRAPLIEHLIELRQRLIWALIALALAFSICFYFAQDIYNLLIFPYAWVALLQADFVISQC